MSLKTAFKTNAAVATEGVWFDYTENADGTTPGFKLARAGRQNKKYSIALRKMAEKQAGRAGVANFDTLSSVESDKLALELIVDHVLLDWRNIQPEDDGVVLPFSRENALALLGNPDWADLLSDLEEKALNADNFREKVLQAQAKNS